MGVSMNHPRAWPKTGHSCQASFCGKNIPYAEPVIMLTVEVAAQTERGLVYSPLVATDEDYLYEPVFYCQECWKSVLEDLESFTSDTPPVEDPYSILRCSCCTSGIRVGEVFAKLTEGEFRASDRNPTGDYTPEFVPMAPLPSILCAPCVNVIEQDVSEIWGELLKQNKECAEGTYMRCWRHGCSADVDCGCVNEVKK